jgi:hypothetical protein
LPEHESNRRAKSGNLREREVDEDHLSRKHLKAEIGVNADQTECQQEGWPQQRDRVAHCCSCAATSAATLVSNREM